MEPMKPMKPMAPMEFPEPERWWPDALGAPSASGSQNDVAYAYFSAPRRLLLRQGGRVEAYDTGEHHIQGVIQASDATHATFTSDQGPVELAQLKQVAVN